MFKINNIASFEEIGVLIKQSIEAHGSCKSFIFEHSEDYDSKDEMIM